MEHTIETGGMIEVYEVFHQLVEKLKEYKEKKPDTWERMVAKNSNLNRKWDLCQTEIGSVDSLTLVRRLAHNALMIWECLNEEEFTIVF